MRLTREKLLKFARNHVSQTLDSRSPRPVSIYLTGSLLFDEPLIGGTTDIDLVYVHDGTPPVEREIVRLTDEVHIDITHLSQQLFRTPRQLRTDPWVGSYLCQNPIPLHDTQHWFEFTQAGVYAQFDLPVNVIERSRPLAESARQGWMQLQMGQLPQGPGQTLTYLHLLEKAANAVACLSGAPLTERRFMVQFPQRAAAVNRPGLVAGLIDLYTSADQILDGDLPPFFSEWEADLKAAGLTESCPPSLQPTRLHYYTRSVEDLWKTVPSAALWILLRTWASAVCQTSEHPDFPSPWLTAMQRLNLAPAQIESRVDELDAYLDTVEETLDIWAHQNGL